MRPKIEWARRKRAVLIVGLLVSVLLTVLAWSLFSPRHVTTLPFTYNAAQGSIRFRAKIAGQNHPLELNSLLIKSVLGNRVYQQLFQGEIGMDRLNPLGEVALGHYRTGIFFDEIAEAELHPHVDGIMGIDPFTPSLGFEGQNSRLGARLTIDFKANRLRLEDGPDLPELRLPPGTLQAPLLRDGDGPYYLILSVNDGPSYPFALGIGCREVLLPTGSVLNINRQGTGYENAVGTVPVNIDVGGQNLFVQANAPAGVQPIGVLGMTILANFRVILDFRHNRLYLEPPDSPSEI